MFLALILDRIVSGYFRAIEQVGAHLDEIDEALILRGVQSDAEEGLLGRLVGVRDITVLWRSLAAHREMFATLAQPEFDKVSETSLGGSLPPPRRASREGAHRDRERPPDGDGIVDAMTRTAQRTNDVMKILTVLNAVLLPRLPRAAGSSG